MEEVKGVVTEMYVVEVGMAYHKEMTPMVSLSPA